MSVLFINYIYIQIDNFLSFQFTQIKCLMVMWWCKKTD